MTQKPEASLGDLYQRKGELTTQIEVAQAQLRAVNDKIIAALNVPKVDTNSVEPSKVK